MIGKKTNKKRRNNTRKYKKQEIITANTRKPRGSSVLQDRRTNSDKWIVANTFPCNPNQKSNLHTANKQTNKIQTNEILAR